jgi:hypothetical protein
VDSSLPGEGTSEREWGLHGMAGTLYMVWYSYSKTQIDLKKVKLR